MTQPTDATKLPDTDRAMLDVVSFYESDESRRAASEAIRMYRNRLVQLGRVAALDAQAGRTAAPVVVTDLLTRSLEVVMEFAPGHTVLIDDLTAALAKQPAPAAQVVTEAALEAALDAYVDVTLRVPASVRGMRAALTAALAKLPRDATSGGAT